MTSVNIFPPSNGGVRFSALCPAIPGITFEGEPVKRRTRGMLAVAAASVTVVSGVAFAPAAIAAPADDSTPAAAQRLDNRPGPLTERQNERRKAAQKLILSGQASPGEDGVVQLADDKYYEASVTGVGRLFTILSEFGDQASGKLGSTPGPLHNEIPEPDRTVNNSTHWMPDFTPQSYRDLFFGSGESFADFYTKQSAGAYTVAGEVSDWVKVPGNASTYGDNAVEDFGGSWQFIEDSGNAWYQSRLDAGKTVDEIKAELASFDVWDRYDADADGNFDEPDGYLDHFQAVHAGEGEDAGGGAQGEDAIWSHRWYVNSTDYGITGPAGAKFGGAQIGDTGIWIGDYTVEAENGGLGVFAHEYAHDLGLPDFYDTAGGENSTGFWTLMSSGSWLNKGEDDIGTTPNHMGPWEKLQLGWLDYSVVNPGTDGCRVHAQPGGPPGRGPGPGARHRRARPAGGERLHDARLGLEGLVDHQRRRPEHDAHPRARPLGRSFRDGQRRRPGTTSRPGTTTCTASTRPTARTGRRSAPCPTRRTAGGRRCATRSPAAARTPGSASATRATAACTSRARSSTTSS